MIERSPPFCQTDRFDLYREKFTVPPYGQRPFLPSRLCYGYGIKVVFNGKKVTAFFTIVENLVSRISCPAIDTHEMIHERVLVF
jgi:hypothetical protein